MRVVKVKMLLKLTLISSLHFYFSILKPYCHYYIFESGELDIGKKNRKANKSSYQNIFASLYKEIKYGIYSVEKHFTTLLLLFYYFSIMKTRLLLLEPKDKTIMCTVLHPLWIFHLPINST